MDNPLPSETEAVSSKPIETKSETTSNSIGETNVLKMSAKPKSRLPFIIAGVGVVAVLLAVGILLSLSYVNQVNNNAKSGATVTPTGTVVPTTTTTPGATTTVTTTPVAPTVPDTSTGTKLFRSNAFAYELSYPQNWTLMESQAYPVGAGPYTSEDLNIVSVNQNFNFSLQINPNGFDGGDKSQNILIKGVNVPFYYETVSDGYSYYFNGKANALGLTIPGVDNLSVRLTAKTIENNANAIVKLQGIMNSITVTSAPISFNQIFTSTAYNFQFNYPQGWKIAEDQVFPIGGTGPYISENVMVSTVDNKIGFGIEINPGSWDGTEKVETFLIHDTFVPFGVLPVANTTEYYFNGSPTALGFNAQGFSKMSIAYMVSNTINKDDAKYILTNIAGSLRSK